MTECRAPERCSIKSTEGGLFPLQMEIKQNQMDHFVYLITELPRSICNVFRMTSRKKIATTLFIFMYIAIFFINFNIILIQELEIPVYDVTARQTQPL